MGQAAINRPEDALSSGVPLSSVKRSLLERYLKNEITSPAAEAMLVTPRPPGGSIPLSFAQQQVWLHAQMAEGIAFYNETITIYRQGALDLGVLERCLCEIIRRHEIWRTTFDIVDGEPIQIVQPATGAFPLHAVDLRSIPRKERDAKARDLATESARLPFDLRTGPLLRVLPIHVDEDSHRLYITLHQIIFDATTAYRVFLPELAALYEAFSAGRPSPLPELQIQYGDFAYWQRKQAGPKLWAQHLAYWRDQLGGGIPLLGWPTNQPRPPIETHRGVIQRFRLADDFIPALRGFARQEHVSDYMTLLAGFVALLHRYTGASDILVGGLTAGRKQAELEPLLGYFVNPLALRFDVSGEPNFRELLSQVRQVVLDALNHEDVPFAQVVAEIQQRKDPSRSPLFQIIFSQQPQMACSLPGWDLATEEVSNGGSKLDLVLVVDDRKEFITGPITYNPDLFDGETITRMVAHWQILLAAAIANPETRICDLPILTEREREQILTQWNDTRKAYPENLYLDELIDAQVERSPDAIAVIFEEQALTYRELSSRANQVASHLIKLGTRADTLIGVCMERSVEMVVALLGILKAGGAYLPLDPDYPTERLRMMLEDSKVHLLLTQEHLLNRLPPTPAQVICLDTGWNRIAKTSDSDHAQRSSPADIAYAIYTSGSTGRPKGVLNSHRGIVNRLVWMQDIFQLTQDDCVLQKTQYSFDVSVWEFFWPLLAGAKLVIAKPGGHRDPAYLTSIIEKHAITTIHFVPSMLEAFLEAGDPKRCRSLKRVICSGEVLPASVQNRFFGCFEAELHNLYGPTEAAIDVTWWSCQRKTNRPMVPIGRPIANTRIYLLDPKLQLVPIGVEGELHIGGVNLARGYLNRPELTAEKFIPSPFGDGTLYKTGDRARYLPDGTIEYLGRLDGQVKIRGIRVELGEIESVLMLHPAVRQAVVDARGASSDYKQLVAYVVAHPQSRAEEDELRRFLGTMLPEYMVPTHYMFLDDFPITPSGKVDRRALPEAMQSKPKMHQSVAPRNKMERSLVTMWENLLTVQSIGIKDDFFDLGGNSLLAARLLARVNAAWETKLSLADFFRVPTIEHLAEHLSQSNRSRSSSSLVPLQPCGSRLPFFCVHSLGSSVHCYLPLARYLGDEQPFYGLQPSGLDGMSAPQDRICDMATRYVEEIQSVQPEGPYYLGGVCLGGVVAFEMAQQLQSQGQEVALLVLIDSYCRTSKYVRTDLTKRGPISIIDKYAGTLLLLSGGDRIRKITATLTSLPGRVWRALQHWDWGEFVQQNTFSSVLKRVREANMMAERTYIPQCYPGRITLLWCSETVTRSYQDLRLAWSDVAEGGLEVHVVPGNHLSMIEEPQVRVMAEKLHFCIERAAAQQNRSS